MLSNYHFSPMWIQLERFTLLIPIQYTLMDDRNLFSHPICSKIKLKRPNFLNPIHWFRFNTCEKKIKPRLQQITVLQGETLYLASELQKLHFSTYVLEEGGFNIQLMTETVSPSSRLVRISERSAVTCWLLDLPSEPFRNWPRFVPREIKQYLSDRNGPIRIQAMSLLVVRYVATVYNTDFLYC